MKNYDELMSIFNQLSFAVTFLEGEEKLRCVIEMVGIVKMLKECVYVKAGV